MTDKANDWIDDLPEVKLSNRTVQELSELLAQKNYSLSDENISIIKGYIAQGFMFIDDDFHMKQKIIRDRRLFFKFSDSYDALLPVDRRLFLMKLKDQFGLKEELEEIEQRFSKIFLYPLRCAEDDLRGHPEDRVAAGRALIVESLFHEFKATYGIKPTTTEGGLFDCFIKLIFSDPALQGRGFAITDTRRLIKAAKKLDD